MSDGGRKRPKRRLFLVGGFVFAGAGSVFAGVGRVFAGAGLALGSLRFAWRSGGRRRTIAARRAGAGRLLGIVAHVPPGTFELEGRRREHLLQLATAVRADGQRRIGKLLDPLHQAMALFALVFVKRQCDVPTILSKLLILFFAISCGQFANPQESAKGSAEKVRFSRSFEGAHLQVRRCKSFIFVIPNRL